MISTAWDYAVFCQMYLNGGSYGNRRILTKETVALITSPHTTTDLGRPVGYAPDEGYGYGWSVTADGVFSTVAPTARRPGWIPSAS